MSEVQMEVAAQGQVVETMLMHLKNGKIRDAAACFAENFEFKDWGIGLEFKNRERLAGILPEDPGTVPRFFVAD
jgi:hypothetical protein